MLPYIYTYICDPCNVVAIILPYITIDNLITLNYLILPTLLIYIYILSCPKPYVYIHIHILYTHVIHLTVSLRRPGKWSPCVATRPLPL